MKKLNVNKQTQKNVIWNTIGAFTTSITSLFYTIILTRFSNLSETGIYSFAFAMACVTVTLASFGGRTYQVTDVKDEISPFSYIVSRYITVFTTLILVLCYLFTKDYSAYKFIIIILVCIFKYLEELSDVYYGILQKENKLYYVGQFQFAKAIINVLLFFLIIKLSGNLLFAIIAITLVNLIFLIFFDRYKAKSLKPWINTINKEHIKKYFKVNIVICLFIFLTSYIANAPKYAIDSFLTNDDQAIFGIIVMPATVMLLVGTFIINPILVPVANMYNDNKIKEIKQMLKKIIFGVSAIGIVALVVCYLIGIPFLNIIYGVNFDEYKLELMIIVFGSILYTLTAIMSYMLTAMRRINIQLVINIIVSIIACIISNILVKEYSIMGGAISYTIIMIVRFTIYIFICLLEKEKNMSSNKKVLHLLASNKFSGAENVACTIIKNSKSDSYYCSPSGEIETTLKEKDINYISLKKLSVFELKKIVKNNNISIIHAHDFKASFIAGLINDRSIEVVSHIHCNPDFIKKWNIYSIIYYLISNCFSKIIVVSNETLRGTVFRKKIEDKTVIIRNVVDVNEVIKKSKEFKSSKYDLVFLGRLIDLKQPLLFIDLINQIKRTKKDIKACIIGDGELYDSCKNEIDSKKLADNIDLLGFKSNPFPYLANSKLAIMPSKFEGTPMSAIECMILGTPVINSGVGGLGTMFRNHKQYVCKTRNEYISCIDHNLKVSSKELKADCDDIIHDYVDLDSYISKIDNIYKELGGGNK